MCCYLVVVGRLACLSDSKGYTGGGSHHSRFNHAGQVLEERSDEKQYLVLQVGGWAWG